MYANDAWHAFLSIEKGSPGEKIWRASIHPEDLPGLDEKWTEVAERGLNHSYFEFRTMKDPSKPYVNDEDCLFLSSTCFAELDQDGNVQSVIGLITNDTIQKAHARESAERLANALEAKRSQENFMGT